MKQKIRVTMLGIYDLILALGAIWIGIMMVRSGNRIFGDYPQEWSANLPFDSWVVPGILAIVVFGLGNLIAAGFSFNKRKPSSWSISAIMGGIFFVSLICQIIILGESYLATVEFLFLSIIQLCLSGYAFSGYRKVFR